VSPDSGAIATVPSDGCVTVPASPESPLLALPPGGGVVVAGSEPVQDIKMRRFGGGAGAPLAFPVDFQTGVAPGQAVAIPIPPDLSTVPWKLRLEGGPATVCGI
jgi:hypothetical protein